MRNLQEIILKLSQYWSDRGCLLAQGYDVEKGAGTFNPMTFLKIFDKGKWFVAFVEPSRRPQDGRYGENPFRLYKHLQYQVILKPAPRDCRNFYLGSLKAIGIDIEKHDIRFLEDNWESPTLGAWGLGWEVRCDGLEITQFTYFQQAGGIDLDEIPVELTYGLERIAMFLSGKKNVFDIDWSDDVKYAEVRKREEREFSRYYFEKVSSDDIFKIFAEFEKETERLISDGLVLPAYDCLLKLSHYFNIIDASGGFDHATRTLFVKKIRSFAGRIAEIYRSKK
ncbi:MAG: glycine--tRNA ligase subunit alpha [Elusimicrobia bacterium]|nr:glycine--tRNA ligase subunit alpha [Elusimicrobiota bacterium]